MDEISARLEREGEDSQHNMATLPGAGHVQALAVFRWNVGLFLTLQT